MEDKKDEKKPKLLTVKEEIKMTVAVRDLVDPSVDAVKKAKKL